jgi:hypothetical protein
LDYPNPTHAQWMQGREIIRNSSGASAKLHRCSGAPVNDCGIAIIDNQEISVAPFATRTFYES